MKISDYLLSLAIGWMLLSAARAGAQPAGASLPARVFTTRDGLTQLQVRNFLEDSRGYIWVAAQSGFNRFDGRHLQPFGVQQGIPADKIRYWAEGPDGAIWYSTMTAVYRFDGARNEAKPPSAVFDPNMPLLLWTLMLDSIPKYLSGRYPCLRAVDIHHEVLIVNSNLNLAGLFNRQTGRVLVLDAKGGCRTFPGPTPARPPYGPVAGQQYISEQGKRFYHLTDSGLVEVARYVPEGDSVRLLHAAAPDHLVTLHHEISKYWLREGDRYQEVDLAQYGFNRIDHFIRDSRGRLHVATDEGYALIHTGGLENFRIPGLRYPWAVLPAGNGAIWVSDHRQGLAHVDARGQARWNGFVRNPDWIHQVFPGRLIGPGGRVLVGGYRGVYHLTEAGLQLFPVGEPVEAIGWDARKRNYVACGKKIYLVDEGLRRVLDTLALPPSFDRENTISDIAIADDGAYWIASWRGVYYLPRGGGGWALFSPENGGMPVKKCNSLRFDSTGVLWAGTDGGLLQFDPGRRRFVRVLAERIQENSNVNCLELLPEGDLAVVTDQELLIVHAADPKNPYVRATFGTLNGFELLEPAENGACWDGRWLWIPAAKGFQRLEWRKIRSAGRPVLRLDRLNDLPLPFYLDTVVLVASETLVRIRPNCINNALRSVSYAYALDDGPWIPAEADPELTVRGLRHGLNRLRVRAQLAGLPERDWPVASVTIEARLPFRQQPAFWILAVGLAGLSLLLLLTAGVQRYRQQRRAKRLQEQLAVARLQTVMAQLNPHVQFNLLSSLQNFIENRSKEEAGRHLLRISRFIREVLEQSMPGETDARFPFPVIPLSREIDGLRNYLELETDQQAGKLRFDLAYEGTSGADKLCIPPQLVQPLVENAVIHGIKPLNRPGYISVLFRESPDELQITISDDGVGIAADSPRPRSALRKSWGGQLLRERLSILSQLGYPARLDRSDRPGGGTIFTITIKKMRSAGLRANG